jgi:hypothetical protein
VRHAALAGIVVGEAVTEAGYFLPGPVSGGGHRRLALAPADDLDAEVVDGYISLTPLRESSGTLPSHIPLSGTTGRFALLLSSQNLRRLHAFNKIGFLMDTEQG